jgi:hypothetical protein
MLNQPSNEMHHNCHWLPPKTLAAISALAGGRAIEACVTDGFYRWVELTLVERVSFLKTWRLGSV